MMRVPLIQVFILVLATQAEALPTGRTHFLSYGPGAAEEALGDAVVSMVSGPASLYYNPARLGAGPSSITGEWTRLVSGVSYSWLGASADLGFSHLGLGLISLNLGDIVARSSLDDPGTNISSYQRAYLIGSGREVLPGLLVGTTMGLLDFNLAGYNAKSMFSDMGASYRAAESLNLGLALKNAYFSGLHFGGEAERYPREARLGASWNRRGLALAAQLDKTLDGAGPSYSAGLAYTLFKILTFRAGMNGYPRFGFGILAPGGRFAFDMAYQAGAVNSSERFTLTYYFKQEQEDAGPKDPYAELEERARSLANYYEEEAKRQLEAKSYSAFDALKKLLALEPSNSDAASALSSESGIKYRPVQLHRWAFLYGEKKRQRLYLRFAVSFADGPREEACLTGQEFMRKWPRDPRSLLIHQLFGTEPCAVKKPMEGQAQ